jgi:O-methyltransferase involved in polyketide biosynthesis
VQAKLTGIPETLLIPLWARATETARSDAIVRDERAVEIIAQIDYDFDKFRKARLSQLGVSIRTMLLDNAVRTFVDRNPESAVVNLGAGLDTRHSRLGLTNTDWTELDLPDALELRRRFFNEGRGYRFLARSMFDPAWLDDVDAGNRRVLIVAEGLFMYFEEGELRPLMGAIAQRFTGGEMLVEVMGPALVGRSRQHDSLGRMDAPPEFKWGIRDTRDLESWHPGIEVVDEWCYFDYYKERARLEGWIARLPFIRPMIAPRIVHLRFRELN